MTKKSYIIDLGVNLNYSIMDSPKTFKLPRYGVCVFDENKGMHQVKASSDDLNYLKKAYNTDIVIDQAN
jgi:hypothetical protein